MVEQSSTAEAGQCIENTSPVEGSQKSRITNHVPTVTNWVAFGSVNEKPPKTWTRKSREEPEEEVDMVVENTGPGDGAWAAAMGLWGMRQTFF